MLELQNEFDYTKLNNEIKKGATIKQLSIINRSFNGHVFKTQYNDYGVIFNGEFLGTGNLEDCNNRLYEEERYLHLDI